MTDRDLKKLGLGTFVGMTLALCATVRNIPMMAAPGWSLIFYSLFAVIFFAAPIAMISGELSTMLPQEGGPQLWVKTAIGGKWGFVVAWFLWFMMFPGMVMISSVIAPLLGNSFGNTEIGKNHLFVFFSILIAYWIITLLNLRFDMAKFGGKIGIWLGVFIPVVVMFVLGSAVMFKKGLQTGTYLGTFAWSKLIPNLRDMGSIKYLSGIMLIFIGIEISSVFIPRLKNANKNYTRGVFIALGGLVLLNVVNALLVANVVPAGTMELANITQPVLLCCQILGLPTVIANIFSFMVFIGVSLQLSAWVTGPSLTIVQAAKDGYLPPCINFHEVNRYGVPRNILFTQATVISVFSLLYVFMDDVSSVFLTLTNLTTIIYCVVYLLIAISFIVLRRKRPRADRPYRVGKKGNAWGFTVAAMFLFSTFIVILVTLFTNGVVNGIIVMGVTVATLLLALIISMNRKDTWGIQEVARAEESIAVS